MRLSDEDLLELLNSIESDRSERKESFFAALPKIVGRAGIQL
jgi:hypothetical protein